MAILVNGNGIFILSNYKRGKKMIKYIYALYYYNKYKRQSQKVRIIRSRTGSLYIMVKKAKRWKDKIRISDHKRLNRHKNTRNLNYLTGKLEHEIIINNIFNITHLRRI